MDNHFIRYGENLRVLPVIHNRIAFAQLVTRGLKTGSWRPDILAVELPASLKDPILRGLELRTSGPLWVGKRVKEWFETIPLSSMTGYQHTQEVLNATSQLLMASRRFALPRLTQRLSCAEEEWLERPEIGFEPLVIVFDGLPSEATYYSNVVLPERRYYASEAYGGSRYVIDAKTWSVPLGGRIWYTPPFYGDNRWLRSKWIGAGNQHRVPRVYDEVRLDPAENWQHTLLRRAIELSQNHVLYLSPEKHPPADDLLCLARERGRQIIHVPHEVLDRRALNKVAKDEHEWSRDLHAELHDNEMEIFSLHSGDAFLAALRFAIKHQIEISWIDRELMDPMEIRLASSRPQFDLNGSGIMFVEDALLEDEGIEAFYQRNRMVAEAARQERVDAERERFMTAKLKSLIALNKQVLFICGAAHWGPIKKLLDDSTFSYAPVDNTDVKGELFCAGKHALIGDGDELPIFLLKYDQLCRSGHELKFSAMQATADFEKRIYKRVEKSKKISPAIVLKFKTYLDRLCCQTGVMVPRFYHLFEAAQSCLDPEGGKAVMQEGMKFYNCPEGVPQLSNVRFGLDGIAGDIDGKTFTFRSRWGKMQYVYDRERGQVQKRSTIKNGSGNELHYADEEWELHMKKMMHEAKRLSSPKVSANSTLPVMDMLSGPIDSRATIRSYLRGERRIYQRLKNRVVLNTLNEFEGFDPVIWIFEKQLKSRLEELVLDEETRKLAVGVVATPRHYFKNGSYQCNFELLATWIPRFADADSFMLQRIKRWLAQGNEAFVPTLAAFSRMCGINAMPFDSATDRVLLLALDYCREYVICVSHQRPDLRVRQAFQRRKKRLLHVSLQEFSEQEIRTLRTPIYGRSR